MSSGAPSTWFGAWATIEAFRLAFEKAGVEFLAEDNGGAGVRLKPKKAKGKRI